jgi:cytochrome c oxidase subunit 4
MAGSGHKESNYMGVFWALLILTLAEVGVFYLNLPRLVMVISLVVMALAKAALVAAYFMHLRFEKRTLALIVISPLLLSALLIIGLTPDASYGWPRKPPTEWVLPGHEGAGEGKPESPAPGSEGADPSAAPEAPPAAPPAQADAPS